LQKGHLPVGCQAKAKAFENMRSSFRNKREESRCKDEAERLERYFEFGTVQEKYEPKKYLIHPLITNNFGKKINPFQIPLTFIFSIF
jgi:hypothetical protein